MTVVFSKVEGYIALGLRGKSIRATGAAADYLKIRAAPETIFESQSTARSLSRPEEMALRRRRVRVANQIDALAFAALEAGAAAAPHILSVACGDLREAQLSYALKEGLIGRYVGLDDDVDGLRTVPQELTAYPIEILKKSMASILTGRFRDAFDFIYVVELFDTLRDREAEDLAKALFALLNPYGRLWIGNISAPTGVARSPVTSQDARPNRKWIYRTKEDMERIADGLPQVEVSQKFAYPEVYGDKNAVVFLEVVKRIKMR